MLNNQIDELKVSGDENSLTPGKNKTKLSKEEIKEKENKAHEFIQKLNKERKEKEKRDMKKREQLDQDMRLEIDAINQSRIDYEEKIKNNKRYQIFERLEDHEKQKERRLKFLLPDNYAASYPNNNQKPFSGDLDINPHHNQFDLKPNQKFRSMIEEGSFPELERKKQDLLRARDIYNNDSETVLLRGHIKELLQHSRPKKIQQISPSPDSLSKKIYQSSILKKVKEEDKDKKIHDIEKLSKRKILHDKQVKYGRIIQKSILPKIVGGHKKNSPKYKRIKEVVLKGLEIESYKKSMKNHVFERTRKVEEIKKYLKKNMPQIDPLDEELMNHNLRIVVHDPKSFNNSNFENKDVSSSKSKKNKFDMIDIDKFHGSPKLSSNQDFDSEDIDDDDNPLITRQIQKVHKSNQLIKNNRIEDNKLLTKKKGSLDYIENYVYY